MPIAVTEDHEALRATALRWAQTHCPPSVPRQVAEAPAGAGELPAAWEKMAAQGWLGLHLAEEQGGQGFGVAELAVVLEELGHALFPGPLLPTVLVSAALARRHVRPGAGPGRVAARTGRRLPHGRGGAGRHATALAGGGGRGAGARGRRAAGARSPHRPSGAAPAGRGGRVRLAPARPRGPGRRGHGRGAARARRHPSHGPAGRRRGHRRARRPGHGLRRGRPRPGPDARCGRERRRRPLVPRDRLGLRQGARPVRPADRPVPGREARAGRHAGGGRAERGGGVGRGSRVERGRRGADDGSRDRHLSARIAGAVALGGVAHCAKECIQLLGGIGFTWEHDAHFYLKRAMANLQLLAGGDVGALESEVAALAIAGARRNLAADLPPEAESLRPTCAPLVAAVAAAGAGASSAPPWPRPG